jgi:hypothetical protein
MNSLGATYSVNDGRPWPFRKFRKFWRAKKVLPLPDGPRTKQRRYCQSMVPSCVPSRPPRRGKVAIYATLLVPWDLVGGFQRHDPDAGEPVFDRNVGLGEVVHDAKEGAVIELPGESEKPAFHVHVLSTYLPDGRVGV